MFAKNSFGWLKQELMKQPNHLIFNANHSKYENNQILYIVFMQLNLLEQHLLLGVYCRNFSVSKFWLPCSFPCDGL